MEFTDEELADMAGSSADVPPPSVAMLQPAAAAAPQPPVQQVQPSHSVQPPANGAYREKKANILIAGPSGSGKSTSLRNLDPERTIILSTENKALPFKGARRFKKIMHVTGFFQFLHIFPIMMAKPDVDVIVVDSLTSLAEFAYNEIVRPIEKKGDNVMVAWSRYKDLMHDVLVMAKNSEDKYIVIIGIDTFIQDDQQRVIRTTDIQGSLKGKIEKEFVCVLWTKVIESGLDESQSYRHVFVTNSDMNNKAKTPMDMFDEQHIDNDIAAVIARCESYAQED